MENLAKNLLANALLSAGALLGASTLSATNAPLSFSFRDLGSGAELRTNLLSQQSGDLSLAAELKCGNKTKGGSKATATKTADAKGHEGKCGEGKCGDKKASATKTADSKGHEGKCGEGKCGDKKATATKASDTKGSEAKCGNK